MKHTLALVLIVFGIVGCEKEPSLLEKCIETNINLFETTSRGNDLKVVFQPDFSLYIEYVSRVWNTGIVQWCSFDFVDKNECPNLEKEIYFSKYSNAFYSAAKNNYEQLTVKEFKNAFNSGKGKEIKRQVLKETYNINARLKCNEQGIY
ncbi:hypothetical protein N9N74_05445 [Gammaproteobacteria bacterium]|nr:hypothetical protein [Gammaproteobacteria bacterium]